MTADRVQWTRSLVAWMMYSNEPQRTRCQRDRGSSSFQFLGFRTGFGDFDWDSLPRVFNESRAIEKVAGVSPGALRAIHRTGTERNERGISLTWSAVESSLPVSESRGKVFSKLPISRWPPSVLVPSWSNGESDRWQIRGRRRWRRPIGKAASAITIRDAHVLRKRLKSAGFFSVSRLACLRYLAMVNQFSWSPLPLPPSNERLLGQSSLSSTFKQRPKKNNTVGSFNLFFMNPKLSSKYFFKANSSPFFFLAAWNPLRNGLDKLDVKTSFIVKTESCFGQHSFSKRCSFLFVSRRGIAIHWARSFETIQSSQFKSESKFEKKYFNSIGWLKRWTKTSTGRKMISPDGWFWHNGVSIYAILV